MKKLVLILLLLVYALVDGSAQTPQAKKIINNMSRYNLFIGILPTARQIEVKGTWELPALKAATDTIEFYLSPKMQNLKVNFQKPEISASSFSLTGKDAGGDTRWTIKLNHPIPSGQTVSLDFSYVSEPAPAPQFNISPEGSFAGGGGELWYPQAAFSNREIGTLHFSAPMGETVIANGILKSAKDQQAKGEFIFQVSKPSKFAFACGKYTVLSHAGKIPFALYLLHPRENSQKIFDGCAKALNFLTSFFGEFPYQTFSLVEVDFRSAVSGTSEYGFIFADDSQFDKDVNLAYWAHEFGHQWWGNLIKAAPKTPGQTMLTEGLAQFGALLAIENIEGEKAAEQFRRYGYQGYNKNQSAAGYFDLIAKGTDLPLAAHIPQNQDEILLMHRLANSKGFIVLDMLSRLLGRKNLADSLRKFLLQNADGMASWKDLQTAIESTSKRNLHWFFEQWLERTGVPTWELTWQPDARSVRGIITQTEPYYRVMVEIVIKGDGRQQLAREVEFRGARTEFRIPVNFQAREVSVDPRFLILHRNKEFRSLKMARTNEH
ncbi:MAG: M1 family aminopeptidase [Acidobacteriota bacterium]